MNLLSNLPSILSNNLSTNLPSNIKLLGRLVDKLPSNLKSLDEIIRFWASVKLDLSATTSDLANITSYVSYLVGLAEHRTPERFTEYLKMKSIYINHLHIWHSEFYREVLRLFPSSIPTSNPVSELEFIHIPGEGVVVALFQGRVLPVIFKYELGSIRLSLVLDGFNLVSQYKALQQSCTRLLMLCSGISDASISDAVSEIPELPLDSDVI